MKQRNSGGEKQPELKANDRSMKAMGLTMRLADPSSRSDVAEGVTWRVGFGVSFPKAKCGKSACPVRLAGTGNAAKPNRIEETVSVVTRHRETKNHCALSTLFSKLSPTFKKGKKRRWCYRVAPIIGKTGDEEGDHNGVVSFGLPD
jgi:hypothetical protein